MTMHQPQRPRFAVGRDDAPMSRLRELASARLRERGDHRFANRWMLAKALLLLACTSCAYAACLLAPASWCFLVSYLAFIGFAMLLAVNVLHDAAHAAFFASARMNTAAMRLTTLALGIDSRSWAIRHVEYHHVFTNVEGWDLDIEPNALLRQAPFHPWRPHHRYQHRYWPVLAAMSLSWVAWVLDWSDRFGRKRRVIHRTGHRLEEVLVFLAFKAAHLLVTLAIPAWFLLHNGLPIALLPIAYLAGQMAASVLLMSALLGTHWAAPEFFQPPDKAFSHSWCEHAFRTSVDWVPKPRFLGYWMGGLNLHLTHHLFPAYSHRHYAMLSELAAGLAAERKWRYRRLGYAQLWREQQEFLRALGEPPGQRGL